MQREGLIWVRGISTVTRSDQWRKRENRENREDRHRQNHMSVSDEGYGYLACPVWLVGCVCHHTTVDS